MQRYSLYAIGEILLVMIGILLALQVNNWNEERKNRQLERDYLIGLQEDLRKDSTVLEDIILMVIQRHATDAQNVLRFMNSGQLADTVSLLRSIVASGHMYFFDANLSTYNEIMNAGHLKLIRDKELKARLDVYINYLKQLDERYEWNKQSVWYDYGNYFRKEYVDGRLFEIFNPQDKTIQSYYPVDWEKMRADKEMERKLSWIVNIANTESTWQKQTKQRVSELIHYIDSLLVVN